MKIIITEDQKKKLFIPRKLSGEGSRWSDWNKEQPTITLDNHTFKLNQYDQNGNKIGLWLDKPELINRNYSKTKEFLSNIFNNLIIDGNYYLFNGEKYLKQDLKNGYIFFKYYNFWTILNSQYSLSNGQIQDLIRIWMEMEYKLGSLTPSCRISIQTCGWKWNTNWDH